MKSVSLLFVLVFATALVAQDAPKAVLVDEHGQLPCDDSLGRMDLWYSELSNNPRSLGLAVISAEPERKHHTVFRQRLMEAYAKYRGASEALRLKFVRASSTRPLQIALWLVPPGAEEPKIGDVDNNFVLPSNTKPFMLGAEFDDHFDNICPGERSDEPIFADFLKDNPHARGNIVVRDRTLAKARRSIARIRQTFQTNYAIPSTRLRFFPRKASVPANYQEPVVEYWYLP